MSFGSPTASPPIAWPSRSRAHASSTARRLSVGYDPALDDPEAAPGPAAVGTCAATRPPEPAERQGERALGGLDGGRDRPGTRRAGAGCRPRARAGPPRPVSGVSRCRSGRRGGSGTRRRPRRSSGARRGSRPGSPPESVRIGPVPRHEAVEPAELGDQRRDRGGGRGDTCWRGRSAAPVARRSVGVRLFTVPSVADRHEGRRLDRRRGAVRSRPGARGADRS